MQSSAASRPCTTPEAADAASRPRSPQEAGSWCPDFPACVLLDTMGRIGPCDDSATTATGTTSAGWRIKVSFEIAEPPVLSRFFVHFPDLESVDSRVSACITGADGAVVLIRLTFPDPGFKYRMSSDFFIYRVAPGIPSLYLLPSPNPIGLHGNHVAILSCDDDLLGNYCLVVIPKRRFDSDGQMWYDLQIFSTKTELWSTRVAAVTRDLEGYRCQFQPSKVFSIGEGLMAWVDLRYGILLCNLLVEEPDMSLIELGLLMASNNVKFSLNSDGMLPPLDKIRDVTFRDGCFRFMEIEYPELDDEDNLMQLRWRATIFTRTIESQNWQHHHTFDSAEFSPGDKCFPLCFPKIWEYNKDKLSLNRMLTSSSPILDMYQDDVVYMICKLKVDDPDGWVLAINTLSNKVERTEPFSAERVYFHRTVLPCAFSNCLRNVQGTCATKVLKRHTNREKIELLGLPSGGINAATEYRETHGVCEAN